MQLPILQPVIELSNLMPAGERRQGMWSFFRRLIGRSQPPSPEQEAAVAAALARLKTDAIPTLVLDAGRGPPVLRLGGLPRLPATATWPLRSGRPIAFVAEMDLAAVRRSEGPAWLPSRGFLHFFYDAEEQPWGFAPEDFDGWSVLHTDTAPSTPRSRPEGLADVFPERLLSARRVSSYPTPERLGVGLDIDADNLDQISDFLTAEFDGEPEHRVGGYPSPVQNDQMELECQLASNGISVGQPEAYASEAANTLRNGAESWRLLLQIDSDDEAGMMWGDLGRLYVWFRENDATAADFSKVWLILQCS